MFGLLRSVIGQQNPRSLSQVNQWEAKSKLIVCTHFPALGDGCMWLLRVLIGSLRCSRMSGFNWNSLSTYINAEPFQHFFKDVRWMWHKQAENIARSYSAVKAKGLLNGHNFKISNISTSARGIWDEWHYSRRGAEVAIIILYPTAASGIIVLSNTPTNYG